MATATQALTPRVSANRAKFARLQFRVRIAVVVLLAVVAPLIPQLGERRLILGGVLFFVVLPLHFIIRWVTGQPNPTGWLDLVAVAGATVQAFIEPAAFAPAFFFQIVHLVAAVPTMTSRWIRGLNGFAVTSMLLVALTRPVDPVAFPMLAVAVVLLPAVLLGATRKRLKDRQTSERVASIAKSLPTVLWEADLDSGEMLTILGAPERVLGTPADLLLGSGYADRIDVNDRERFNCRFSMGDRRSLSYRFETVDGSTRWLTDQIEETVREDTRLLRGITIDVTELHLAQETAVRQSEIVERMSATTIVISGGVPVEEAIIISANDPLGDLLDYPEETVGLPFGHILPELAEEPWLVQGIDQLQRVDTVHTGPRRVAQVKGSLIVEVQLFSMPDGTTALIIENVTSREQAQDTVRHQALHDALTNLPNRVALMTRMNELLEREEPFAFALLDLNRFKAVNDTLGHLTGDELLRVIGVRLASAVEGTDLVARLGGDEFAIILTLQDNPEIDQRLDRVIKACRDRVTIKGSSISVGVSIGVVSAPADGDSSETLLRLADVAMYDAKKSRNTIRVYEPSPETGLQRLELMSELDQAFATGQFVPYFQPKCDAATGKLVGFEALARWQHPVRGVLAPIEFIELISVSGRFDDLLHAVLWTSVDALSQMPEDLHVAINLSAVNLRAADIATTFRTVIESFDIAPGRLTVELTESEFMDDTGRIEQSIGELAELGLGVAVDDFGTGYSSLSHLRNLPLTELKVDQQFVTSMVHSPEDRVVVQALVGLAHDLGLTLTAEGVEDLPTVQLLQSMGCDTIQGYYYGRPMSIPDFQRTFLDDLSDSASVAVTSRSSDTTLGFGV